ncbi:GntR family transcriptional regulator [Paenibacillus sp. FA6]|uniref:GntR family transcriptional regulator n=1 Tax=Paenibacillus sp. FA6 TaxID=3413029 RepID=UPI003F655BC6
MSVLSLLPLSDIRKPLSEQVYHTIREAIVTLQLEPGLMIYENDLAESLGVSRTPIREAIRNLVNDQLLEVLPQRGTRVAYISERKVLETRFIRVQLERAAFRIVAQTWNSELMRPSRQLILNSLEGQQLAAENNNIVQFLQLDEVFHRIILELADNQTLMNVVYHMRGHLNRLRYLVIREYDHMSRVIDEHYELLKAIEANDEEVTTRLLEDHLGKMNSEVPELRQVFSHYFVD